MEEELKLINKRAEDNRKERIEFSKRLYNNNIRLIHQEAADEFSDKAEKESLETVELLIAALRFSIIDDQIPIDLLPSLAECREKDLYETCRRWLQYYEESEKLLDTFITQWLDSAYDLEEKHIEVSAFLEWAHDTGLHTDVPWWGEALEKGIIDTVTKEKSVDFPLPPSVTNSTSSPKNCFILKGDFWEISFQGENLTPIKDTVNIRAIAERLDSPNKSWKGKISVKRDGQKIGKKERDAFKNIISDIYIRMETSTTREEKEELEETLSKTRKAIKEYGATINDSDGSITWNRTSAKEDKEWNTHSERLRRGIKKIKNQKKGKDLAEFLEKYLIPDKYYRPPVEFTPEWEIIYITNT